MHSQSWRIAGLPHLLLFSSASSPSKSALACDLLVPLFFFCGPSLHFSSSSLPSTSCSAHRSCVASLPHSFPSTTEPSCALLSALTLEWSLPSFVSFSIKLKAYSADNKSASERIISASDSSSQLVTDPS